MSATLPLDSAVSPKIDIRDTLIAAGLSLLCRKGYAATSINEVVALAKVPKGSFYYYYKSKESFVEAVLQSYGEQKKAQLDQHLNNPALSPLNRLRAFLADGIRWMQADQFESGCLVGQLAQEVAASNPRLRDVLHEMTQEWHRLHEDLFQAAVERGEVPARTHIPALVETYFMLMQGAMLESKMTRSPRSFQNAHWLIFEQVGQPAHRLDEDTEALLALPPPL